MNAAILLLALLSPAPKKHGSKEHLIAVWAPNTWTVAAGKGKVAFVITGPALGRGTPQARLLAAGKAGTTTLEQKTKLFADAVRKRPGWRVLAQKRKTVGPYPAIRIGIDFNEEGKKGRARFTVLLMGGYFFVLEMSAPAASFPGSTFDAIEKSLEVPWSYHKLEIGVTLEIPRGWSFDAAGPRATLTGPVCGLGPPIVRLGAGKVPERVLKGAKPGPKLKFLGAARPTQLVERLDDEPKLRVLYVQHDGLYAMVFIPVATWNDMLPTVAEILSRVKPPKPDGKK